MVTSLTTAIRQTAVQETGVLGTSVDHGARSAQLEASVAGKPFRFNPPMHNLNNPVRVDFSSKDPAWTQSNVYLDERMIAQGNRDASAYRTARLGRFIQHELSAGSAATNTERFGFRFLYNPASVTISSSRNDSVILDRQSTVNAAISGINQNFQVISFALLLNRMPDVMSASISASDYTPGITTEDLAGLRKYGTHWDLEILYRMCNGIFNLKDRGRTSDIGMIIPSNVRLYLGPGQNHFGFVQSVTYNDVMFSRDMIPVRTEVNIVMRRHVDMAPEDMDSFNTLLGQGTSAAVVLVPRRRLTREDTGGLGSGIMGSILSGGWGLMKSAVEGAGDLIGDILDPVLPGNQGGDADADASGPGSTKDAPVPSGKITCEYGRKGSVWSSGHHTGEDYSAGKNTPVRSTKAGVVIFAGRGNRPGWGSSYGVHVIVETSGIRHLYAHMMSASVKTGQQVTAGQQVGLSGNTGMSQEGTSANMHLHYEERHSPYGYNVDCRKPQWGNGSG